MQKRVFRSSSDVSNIMQISSFIKTSSLQHFLASDIYQLKMFVPKYLGSLKKSKKNARILQLYHAIVTES